MKLKLKKEIVENKELSDNAVLVYVGLVMCMRHKLNRVFANRNMLMFYLTNKEKTSKRFDDSLKEGLQELLDKKIIICKQRNGSDYFLGLDNIQLNDNDKFVFVSYDDVNKILNCSSQRKKSILRFYLLLLGTFIGKNHIKDIREPEKYNNILGMMPQEYLAEIADVSTRTVSDYIKILEELELIYVSRCSFTFKDSKGRVKRHNNIYGLYSNKELIDDFASIRYSMYDDFHQVQNSNATNKARSLMQKYNYLRGGTVYDKATVDVIYNYVSEYNKKHPKKKKDMTPFVKYGYEVDN